MTLNRKLLVGLGFTALLVVAGTVWAANSGGIEEVAEAPGFDASTTETAAVAADAGVATTGVVGTAVTDTTVVPASLTTETLSTETVPAVPASTVAPTTTTTTVE